VNEAPAWKLIRGSTFGTRIRHQPRHGDSLWRALGDFEDRRRWRKLSTGQIAEATAALERGERWRDVASTFRVSLATLQETVSYRKRGRLRRSYMR
jgi:hypothetical protein